MCGSVLAVQLVLRRRKIGHGSDVDADQVPDRKSEQEGDELRRPVMQKEVLHFFQSAKFHGDAA